MFAGSVSRNRQRLHNYHIYSTAFAYPDDRFFECFGQLALERREILARYDRLFRVRSIWLYTAEYTAKGDFQKSRCLADIAGFYRGFGLKLGGDRPDALDIELEFMHYLIFKTLYALENDLPDSNAKAQVCLDGQRKFFSEFLAPGATPICERICAEDADEGGSFYKDIARQMMSFVEEEESLLSTRLTSIEEGPR